MASWRSETPIRIPVCPYTSPSPPPLPPSPPLRLPVFRAQGAVCKLSDQYSSKIKFQVPLCVLTTMPNCCKGRYVFHYVTVSKSFPRAPSLNHSVKGGLLGWGSGLWFRLEFKVAVRIRITVECGDETETRWNRNTLEHIAAQMECKYFLE